MPDYQDIARYKINEAVDKTKKEISKTQDELTNFARLKVQTFNGALKKAVNYLNSNTKIHPERIGRLTNLYKASSSKYAAGISHGSISLNCNQLIGSNLDLDLEDFAKIALGGPIGFLLTSSEKLTEGAAGLHNGFDDLHGYPEKSRGGNKTYRGFFFSN